MKEEHKGSWDEIFTPLVLCKLAYGIDVSVFNGKPEEIRVAKDVIKRVKDFFEENYDLPKPKNK